MINKIYRCLALKLAQIQKKQDRSSIKLSLKVALTSLRSPQIPKSVSKEENGNDITLTDIYTESESKEEEN